MADPQSAGGTASLGSSTASSQASLVTCTTTVTVFPCSGISPTTTSTTTSSPTGGARGSIVGSVPGSSQAASTSASSSTSALTSSATSAAATSADSSSSVPSSASQDTTSQPILSSSSSSSVDDAGSATSSAVFIAGPASTTASTSSNPTPFVTAPSDSTTDSAADVQTVQQGPESSATDGVIFQSVSDGDSSFTTATMTPTLLGTVDGSQVASTSASGPLSLASNSLGGGNNSSANSGTMNAAGAHTQSAASKRAVIAGAAVGGTLGFLLLLVGFLFFLRRRDQAARANSSRPMQKYFSTQGSVLGYGPDPFDRSTGIESVRTAADAFRGPGMIQHMSPAPSVYSARSIVQKMSRPDSLGGGGGVGMAEATPRSWTTFQPQRSPLRESTSTAGGVADASGQGPKSPSLAVPLMTPTDGFLSPPSGAPLSTSAPGPGNFSTTRSSKASSSLYSSQGASGPRRSLADSVDPFRDSVVVAGPSYGFGYDSARRRSIGDSVDPFRDNSTAPDPHAGMYSPPGRAL